MNGRRLRKFGLEVAHQFLLGVLSGALVVALWWLLSGGGLPNPWLVWGLTPAVSTVIGRISRRSEINRLREQYELPAISDEERKGGN